MSYLATIGTFDGVHRGHQRLLRRVIGQAKKSKLRSLVILFSEPPRFYFRPEHATPLVTLPSERREILRAFGIDQVRILRFGKFWAEMSHVRFFEGFLLKRCRVRGLIVGPDFAFGHERLGNVSWLRQACRPRKHLRGQLSQMPFLGRTRHVHFQVQPLLLSEAWKISSTRIRELLAEGDVVHADRLLGRPYFVDGKVIKGRGLGKTIGVPTANLKVDPKKLLPLGVYKVRVRGSQSLGRTRIGVCNIGTRPTVGGKNRIHVEVHIPGFRGNLYDKTLRLEFLKHLRPEKKFSSLQALKAQIQRDIYRSIHS